MTVTATAMYEKLATSGLDKKDAQRLKIKFLSKTQTAKVTDERFSVASMQLPYFEPNGKANHFWRIRLLEQSASFKKKTPRYTQPADTSPRVYLPPLLNKNMTWSDVAADAEQPIIVTEGELKAACATKYALPTIGLGGVWSWRSKKKAISFIADLERFAWDGRDVYLVFDSDLATNAQVRRALHALSKELTDRGAEVYVAYLPGLDEHDGKTGLDDFVVARGAEAFLDVLRGAEPYDLSRALHELNLEVAYVEDPGLIVRLRDGLQYKPGDFTAHAFAHRTYLEVDEESGKAKKKPLAPAWLKWPGRFTLRRFVYEPGGERVTSEGAYNLWRGWGAEPKKGDVSRWHRLLDHVFGKDDAARQWFERWCAIQFQRPGVKLYTSVLLWSSETGSGKSLAGVSLGKIFGENFVELNESMLTGNFNGWAKGKQFALGDEVTGNDSRQFADLLKAMITRTTIHINAKYMPVYETADVINYLFTSNHPDALFIEDKDRRYFVHEVTSGPLGLDFALDYDEWLHRGPGPSALFDYFLRYDVGDFRPQERAPTTASKESMIYHAKSDLDRWVADLVADPDAALRVDGVPAKADLWTPAQLLRLYDPLEKTRVTVNAVGKSLRRAGVTALPVVRTSAGPTRLYAIRNADKWAKAKPKAVVEAFEAGPGGRRKKY